VHNEGAHLVRTILLLFLLQFLSCTSSRPEKTPATAHDPVPGDLRIVIGEGGGIAGLMSGYSVDAAGDVFEWKGRAADQNLNRVGALDPDTLEALWSAIKPSRLLERESVTANANYIVTIAITAEKSVRNFEWPVAAKEDSARAPIIRFRARCLEAVRAVIKH
jgi:hypothetical protein